MGGHGSMLKPLSPSIVRTLGPPLSLPIAPRTCWAVKNADRRLSASCLGPAGSPWRQEENPRVRLPLAFPRPAPRSRGGGHGASGISTVDKLKTSSSQAPRQARRGGERVLQLACHWAFRFKRLPPFTSSLVVVGGRCRAGRRRAREQKATAARSCSD